MSIFFCTGFFHCNVLGGNIAPSVEATTAVSQSEKSGQRSFKYNDAHSDKELREGKCNDQLLRLHVYQRSSLEVRNSSFKDVDVCKGSNPAGQKAKCQKTFRKNCHPESSKTKLFEKNCSNFSSSVHFLNKVYFFSMNKESSYIMADESQDRDLWTLPYCSCQEMVER